MDRRIRLIVNPSSGGGRALQRLPRVESALALLRLPYETHRTTSLDHGRELALEGAAAGETIVTLSGDGLLGAVAGALARCDHPAVLGVLPGGRGNDFARVIGVPLDDLDAACAILRDGVERPLDVGCLGEDRPFIGIASLGFDSDANRIANEAPSRLGNLVYAYGALRALAAWKPATFELSLDGAPPRSYTGYSVAFANSKAYGGGMYLAPGAELDDGLLDVVVTRHVSKLRFLSQLPKVFKGTHVDNPEVEVLRARTVEVSADRPFQIYADGDPIGELPARVTVLPRAVRVVCPR
ncbi:MAG TPA: diacylglycerol kinase family protein [Capillimicrobium sp.]|nr:diacylglycerol kinase family protein [Capillimicrobium sp.]